jgi:hypothetical protein
MSPILANKSSREHSSSVKDVCMKTALMFAITSVLLASCALPDKAATDRPRALNMLTRADWGANPPVAEMKAHKISRITIHHTATLQKPERTLAEKLRALQKFSQTPGTLGNGKAKPAWPDVPYHFYIDCHGEIAEGRNAGFVGDTNTAYDPSGHLLVVLEGNFEEEKPTEQQVTALRNLLASTMARYRINPELIGTHQDFAETLCPGKNLHDLVPAIRQQPAGE